MPIKSKFAKKAEEKKEGEAQWLCTFNDLMTLLLTFFVLLFTMGSIDLKDMKNMQGSLQSALGMLEAGDMTSLALVAPVVDTVNFGVGKIDYTKVENKLAKELADLDLADGVSVEETETGALISLKDAVLFDSGGAAINETGVGILAEIGRVLKNVNAPVCVKGHTDDVPIHTARYPSNWDLSVSRAVTVVRYFIEEGYGRPERFSAAGYGETHPVVPNDTPEHRAMNRRVEIVLIIK